MRAGNSLSPDVGEQAGGSGSGIPTANTWAELSALADANTPTIFIGTPFTNTISSITFNVDTIIFGQEITIDNSTANPIISFRVANNSHIQFHCPLVINSTGGGSVDFGYQGSAGWSGTFNLNRVHVLANTVLTILSSTLNTVDATYQNVALEGGASVDSTTSPNSTWVREQIWDADIEEGNFSAGKINGLDEKTTLVPQDLFLIEDSQFNAYRLPTQTEWADERASWSSDNLAGAYGSPLKLVPASIRDATTGVVAPAHELYYWSSSPFNNDRAYYLRITSSVSITTAYRGNGLTVRLILDGTYTQSEYDNQFLGKTFVYDGITYGYCYNPITQRVWLDRNLGASQVAVSSIDSLAEGDLYQWGRYNDGHQVRTSPTTPTPYATEVPNTNLFVIGSLQQWLVPYNNGLWQGVNGVNVPSPLAVPFVPKKVPYMTLKAELGGGTV